MITIVKLLTYLLTVTFVCVHTIKAPEVYSLSKFPAFNTVLLTVFIMMYIKSLHFLNLYNCNYSL